MLIFILKTDMKRFFKTCYYFVIGCFKRRKYIIGCLYFGGKNNQYGIYEGNGKFLEYEQYVVPKYGTHYVNSKKTKYTNVELGKYNWEKSIT